MTRPVYFTVERINGEPQPFLYWDELPWHRKIPNLEYIVRLDEQPNGERLSRAGLAALFSIYQVLKRRGKLPPRWEPPKPRKEHRA